MKLRNLILLAMALTVAPAFAADGLTAEQAFRTAPRKVFPMLTDNSRLDMVDYYHSSNNLGAKNSMGGVSKVTAITPGSLSVTLTEASNCQVAVLPAGSDTLIAVITTVTTPSADSKLTVFTSDWSKIVTPKVFTKPSFKDWLSPEGRKHADEAESMIPFLLISYSYDPSDSTLTLTNNIHEFLSREIYDMVKPYLLNKIVYQFNGKRFTRLD